MGAQASASVEPRGLRASLFLPLGDRLDPTAVNILQRIIELGAETHDATAVASVVAMAPGTVTVVKQVRALPSPLRCHLLSHPPSLLPPRVFGALAYFPQ